MSRRSVARRAVDSSVPMREVLNDSVSLVVGDKVFDNGRFTNSVDTGFMPLNSTALSQHRPLADERRSFLLCNFPATLILTDGVAVLNWIDENNFIEVTCRPVALGVVNDLSVGAVPSPGLKLWDSVPNYSNFLNTQLTADTLGLGWSNDVVASMNIGTGGLLGGGTYYSTGFWQARGGVRSAWAGFKYAGHLLAIRQWKNGQPTWLGERLLRASTGVSWGSSQIELSEVPIAAENFVGVSAWCYQVPSSQGGAAIRVIATATRGYNALDKHLGGQNASKTTSRAVYADSDTDWSPVGGVMLGRSRDLWNDETDYGQMGPNGERFPTAFRRVFDAEEIKDDNIGGPLATSWLTPDPNITDSFLTDLTSDYPFRGINQARYLGNFKDDYPLSANNALTTINGISAHTRTSDYILPPFDTDAGGWQQVFAKDCPCHPHTILTETYLGTSSASINAPAEGEDATAAQLAVAAAPWGAAFQGVQPKHPTSNLPSIAGSPITGQMRTGADYGESPGEMSDDFVAASGVRIYTDYPMPTSYSEHTTHYLYPFNTVSLVRGIQMRIAPSPREKLLEGSPVASRSFRQWLPSSIALTAGTGLGGYLTSYSASFSKVNYCTVDMGYTGAVDDPTNSTANRNVVIQSLVYGNVSITPLIGNPANWAAVYGGPPANFINDDLLTIKSIWSMRLTIVESVYGNGYSPYESGASGPNRSWPSINGFGRVRGPMIARSMFEFGGMLMPSTKFASPNMVGPGNDESAYARETGYAGEPTQTFFYNARSKLDTPSGEVVPGSPPVGTDGEQRVLLSSYQPLIPPLGGITIAPDTTDVADVTNTPNIINNIRVGSHSCRCGFVLRPPRENTDNTWHVGHPSPVSLQIQLDNICHFYGHRPYFLMGEHYPTAAYPGTPFGQGAASWSGPEAGRILATDPYCQGRYAELSFSLVE